MNKYIKCGYYDEVGTKIAEVYKNIPKEELEEIKKEYNEVIFDNEVLK